MACGNKPVSRYKPLNFSMYLTAWIDHKALTVLELSAALPTGQAVMLTQCYHSASPDTTMEEKSRVLAHGTGANLNAKRSRVALFKHGSQQYCSQYYGEQLRTNQTPCN
eukprot:6087318-Amphidinium_carterae.1